MAARTGAASRRGVAVNAETGIEREATAGTAPTYGFTFGHYTQAAPWTDVRALTWAELAELLTRHETGPKEGSCIVPATFSGTRRQKADARQIDAAFLDSDAGATLQEIAAAVQTHGWAAIVSSTHSHLSTRTVAKRGTWDRFRITAADQAQAAAAFLVQEKGYLPRVAEGARVVEETAEQVDLRAPALSEVPPRAPAPTSLARLGPRRPAQR